MSADLARDLDRLDEVFCDGLARFGGDFLAGKVFRRLTRFSAQLRFELCVMVCRSHSQALIIVIDFWRWNPCGIGCRTR